MSDALRAADAKRPGGAEVARDATRPARHGRGDAWSDASHRRGDAPRGARLSTRLAFAFALVATLPLVAIAPPVLNEVRAALGTELEHRVEAAAQRTRAEIERRGARLAEAAAATAADPELRRSVAGAAPVALLPVAGERMRARGLDVLLLLDAEGRVISSGHLPARAGDRDRAALAIEAPTTRLVEVRDPAGIVQRPALVAGARSADGALHVVAGEALDGAFLEALAMATGSDLTLLVDGAPFAAAAAPAPPPRGALAGWLPAPEAPAREVPLSAGMSLRLAANPRSLAVAQARIVGVLALFLLAAIALAIGLGVVLARRVVRPVEALAAGAARVAGGDLAHRVEVRAGGELGALVRAFNRMTADLERERERAAVAERIAAWREVARRLAHEIKNPLAPIAMSVETLRDAWRARSPALDEIFESSAGAVLEEVDRLKAIVDEFSRFARLPPPRLERLAPAEAIAPLAALYAAPPAGLTFATRIEPDLPPIRVDRDQILQLLLNLVQNAEQAMGGRGAVEVVAFRDGADVILAVDDEGPGVPPAQRERIFEPYVTGRVEGTGLGLAIARRIAEEHGGKLSVETGPLGGARFALRLPAAEADAGAAAG